MRSHLILFATLALAACAAAPPRPPLIVQPGASASEVDRQFREALALRYGGEAGQNGLIADLTADGFTCANQQPAIGAKPGAVLDVCLRARRDAAGKCSTIWSVEARFKNLSRALDSVRVEPVGRFERICD